MAEAARRIDLIDTAPRFAPADVAALNARFEGVDTGAMLARVLDGLVGRAAIVSSFGTESVVLLHLIATVDRAVPVLFLETGKHFPETIAYRDLLIDRLGLTGVVNLTPDPDLLARRDAAGERWTYDPDGCCDIRKVQPLAAALAGFDATFTGRKGFQASTRAHLPLFEIDHGDTQGRLKINPLARWGKADLARYMSDHDLPPHPLEAQGYPSIGCATCTSRVAPGEDSRAGRWRGWNKLECGIHLPLEAGEGI